MKALIRRMLGVGENESRRIEWVAGEIAKLPAGGRLLDAGAGEQRFRPYCGHLRYVSQDFGKYDGTGNNTGLQMGSWDNGGLDIVSDIVEIPEQDNSFDAVLCTEVFEHIPEPLRALDEFARLLRPGGKLILTAPFASLVHFAPYFFHTGFSRYWYERHLPQRSFELVELVPNGDWYDFVSQEIVRLPRVVRSKSRLASFLVWPFALLLLVVLRVVRGLGKGGGTTDLAALGFHCVAIRADK